MKRCNSCKVEKSLDEFYDERTSLDGKALRCKECSKANSRRWREANREHAKEKWREASKRYSRGTALMAKYGLTVEDYDRLKIEQGFRCGICGVLDTKSRGRNPGRLCVDHDHVTGKVRGLLCSPCNAALGSFGDNLDRLRKAVNYLERACHESEPVVEYSQAAG